MLLRGKGKAKDELIIDGIFGTIVQYFLFSTYFEINKEYILYFWRIEEGLIAFWYAGKIDKIQTNYRLKQEHRRGLCKSLFFFVL